MNVWDIANGKRVDRLSGADFRSISSLVFADNDRTLAIAQNEQISFWEIPSGRKVRDLSWHHHPIDAMVVSPDRRWLASADQKGWVKLWDLKELSPK